MNAESFYATKTKERTTTVVTVIVINSSYRSGQKIKKNAFLTIVRIFFSLSRWYFTI